MNRLMIVSLLGIATALGGCVSPPPKPNDPYYAPVLPRTPLPAAQNNGAIYQAGFEQNLYDDRKAFRVGDIITITLNEKTQASKKANSDIQKDSKTKMGLTSLFGSGMTTNNPIGGGDLSLSAEYGGSRDAKGDSQAGQSNSLTGSITVTVAEVLPNGILSVRGEKWMTLNTGNELVRIAGLVRADDIATDNTVSSTRVADARITYSGTGAFADASQPGWLDRFFLSPLWPF
ncbi:TPA: flagellar basal body L-ring protein FlgH [Pseudomonas aeruginosa]|jgi:flagellar L-ring protein precursor FlgH|uniref:Flagellar L-ring protein n=3 Tax=Pseudomonas aeruginosa TaxID=287 RepID=FLGH_PSEAB|nr:MULTISPECIES: flagellar basal body L-ring protein FlgH [Pseudomonas]Q02IQ0.1 RecName: Full=Flagellar L-ring protein; AltName: Full=Basal body L-ring protein; Flags: Precursor [Pseudomonas aeruginosa UCBPP-PA14]AID83868.1 flagellar basal body L-ring protein [Pseudomonas aeruginosa VRFPA04]KEA25429.1 flagellar basal body L-ring protein [Pseudomonas aeruginosa C2773C]SAJ23284.1 flagellar basal body L-ring protein [Enterobacter cloacae]HCL2794875.1 flagellar basal body L-ring protein FlgH [Pseu